MRFLPNYKKNSLKQNIAAIAVLSMTLNVDENKAVLIAHNIGSLKLQFDKKYNLGLIDSVGIIPNEVPK